jgi:hypothetical protein
METSALSNRILFAESHTTWANWDFGANSSNSVSGGILKRDVNVAVCFHFCVNDATSERIPLFLRRHSRFYHAR